MGVLLTDPPNATGRSFGPSQRLLTAADLAAFPTSLPTGDVRYELDDGVLVVMPTPGDIHGHQQNRISTLLAVEGEWKGHGEARTEVGIVLRRNPDRVVGADAAFILKQSLPVRRSKEGYLETIPELVVEVKSKNDSDAELNDKVDEYLAAGVRIVWVLDSDKRTVTIHRSNMPACVLTVTEMLTADGLIPDFNVPVSQLFPAS
jgi:Uma2 family endonuclease